LDAQGYGLLATLGIRRARTPYWVTISFMRLLPTSHEGKCWCSLPRLQSSSASDPSVLASWISHKVSGVQIDSSPVLGIIPSQNWTHRLRWRLPNRIIAVGRIILLSFSRNFGCLVYYDSLSRSTFLLCSTVALLFYVPIKQFILSVFQCLYFLYHLQRHGFLQRFSLPERT
jgi:hypothetical protein